MTDSELEKSPLVDEPTIDPDVPDTLSAQDEEAVKFGKAFLRQVVRLRGVRITRDDFLTQELRKLGLSRSVIEMSVASTPVQAGVSIQQLDKLAQGVIAFETNKSAAASFLAGVPGGLAMFATVPGDVMQYYVHAFRIMQKLAYLYGWQDFLDDLDEVDDETLGKFALFLGVMMGVGGAASSLTTFASQVARPALQKQITAQALTKTAWYGPMKQVLKMVGIKVTKDSFAKTVTKAVPIAGGFISGGMTFMALRSQSERLRDHLRQLPPPGADAAEFHTLLHEADEVAEELAADKPVAKIIEGAASGAGDVANGVKHIASGATNAVSGFAGKLVGRAKKGADKGAADV